MVILTAILLVVLLVGFFWLFRSSGRLGQRPGAHERMKHTSGEGHGPGPRATGIN